MILYNLDRLLIFTLISTVLCVSFAAAAHAQDSAEALGAELVEKIKSGDREGLAALVDPESVAYLKENDPGRLDSMLDVWAELEIPGEYQLTVRKPAEIENYNPSTQTFDMGQITMFFPVIPDSFIELSTETEARVEINGEEGVAKGMAIFLFDAARKSGDRWYLVIPVIKEKRPAGNQ